MLFMELTQKRESTRKYAPKPVPRDLIDRCLEAARLAPSACNSQPWSFIVIDDEETKTKIVEKTMSGIYMSNAFVKTAPVIIVFITERSIYSAHLGGMFRDVKYNLIDIGIAGEHIALQAAELGLGTCWLGWFNEKELKKILGLPKSTKIDIVMSLGYPDESVPPRDKKRRSLDDIRSYGMKS
ncbi:MAG: nitroreductase family protein [Candidatus Omnitrophota bacterium]